MKKNNIIISLTIVLLIIAIIVGGYFIVKTNSKKKDQTNNFIKETTEKEEINTHKELNKNVKEVNDIGDKNSMNEFVIEVNNRKLVVEAQSNSSVKALLEKLKEGDIIINAQDYGNFEKVGDLGFSLPREDTNITTVAGDIVLYQGDQISLFYNSNSWSYTKLGKIQNVGANELRDILGEEDVTLTLTLKR